MTPLERAARALIDIDPTMKGYHETHVACKLLAARAVLTALREPSDVMKISGGESHGPINDYDYDDHANDASMIWQAMIDTALDET